MKRCGAWLDLALSLISVAALQEYSP